nr:MAG TPA: hypothetical protein [Caudoviricetes sp.]
MRDDNEILQKVYKRDTNRLRQVYEMRDMIRA